jgi:hypothetical protein
LRFDAAVVQLVADMTTVLHGWFPLVRNHAAALERIVWNA